LKTKRIFFYENIAFFDSIRYNGSVGLMMILISKTLNIRGYKTSADRERAIKMLKKSGFSHFIRYHDTQSAHALIVAKAKIFSPNA